MKWHVALDDNLLRLSDTGDRSRCDYFHFYGGSIRSDFVAATDAAAAANAKAMKIVASRIRRHAHCRSLHVSEAVRGSCQNSGQSPNHHGWTRDGNGASSGDRRGNRH